MRDEDIYFGQNGLGKGLVTPSRRHAVTWFTNNRLDRKFYNEKKAEIIGTRS